MSRSYMETLASESGPGRMDDCTRGVCGQYSSAGGGAIEMIIALWSILLRTRRIAARRAAYSACTG